MEFNLGVALQEKDELTAQVAEQRDRTEAAEGFSNQVGRSPHSEIL